MFDPCASYSVPTSCSTQINQLEDIRAALKAYLKMEKLLHRISLNLWISDWRTIQESRRTRSSNLYLFLNIWEKKLCYIPEIQEMICDCSITLHSLVRFYYWEKVTKSGNYEDRNYCENRFHEVAEFRLQSTKLYMLCESELRKQNWLKVKILF